MEKELELEKIKKKIVEAKISLHETATNVVMGKGNPEFFAAKVKAGTVLFEMKGVDEDVAREAMRLASHKLPIKTKFIKREEA